MPVSQIRYGFLLYALAWLVLGCIQMIQVRSGWMEAICAIHWDLGESCVWI
jgi:hypothetical protein